MNERLVARAPGKLFLLGEYAVLDGSPAIVAAIDRAAEVHLTRTALPGRFRIEAPQLGTSLDAPLTRLPAIDGPLRFALAVLHELDAGLRERLLDGLRISITTELGAPAGDKPGLGSSAAVTSAVAAAVLLARSELTGGHPSTSEIFATAWRAHRAAQGGAGSGADVGASVYGGIIRFEAGKGTIPTVTPLHWPAHVELLAAWSGTSASTTDLVARYQSLKNGHSQRRASFVAHSRSLTEAFVEVLTRGAGDLEPINAAGLALERFADDTGLPLITPALRSLLSIARRHNAAAKISGAGGGDCGIAFTADPVAATRIRADWQAAGLYPLALRIAPQGVTCADG